MLLRPGPCELRGSAGHASMSCHGHSAFMHRHDCGSIAALPSPKHACHRCWRIYLCCRHLCRVGQWRLPSLVCQLQGGLWYDLSKCLRFWDRHAVPPLAVLDSLHWPPCSCTPASFGRILFTCLSSAAPLMRVCSCLLPTARLSRWRAGVRCACAPMTLCTSTTWSAGGRLCSPSCGTTCMQMAGRSSWSRQVLP